MNEQFRNKVLYISDEPMLKEVRQLLIENGQNISPYFSFSPYPHLNYLKLEKTTEVWYINEKMRYYPQEEITLTEFKELLTQNK